MSEVILSEGQSLDAAIKRFRRQVQRSGILKDLRQKRFYMKPSVAKRRKSAAAQERRRRSARKAAQGWS